MGAVEDNNSDTDEMEDHEIEMMKYNSDTDEMGDSEVEKMKQASWADHSTDQSEQEEMEPPAKVQEKVQQPTQQKAKEEKVEKPKADLPVCKWGASCTRKNPQHFKEFSHPTQQQPMQQEPEEEVQKPNPKSKKDLMKQQKNDEAYEQLMKTKKQKIN
mmetsp:Transcript_9472/g.13049  ORF Transcript_9472/g.13049 Transcript_9472/m.13049 type:complete len:158 (+) Transcript_9472:3-476(+)